MALANYDCVPRNLDTETSTQKGYQEAGRGQGGIYRQGTKDDQLASIHPIHSLQDRQGLLTMATSSLQPLEKRLRMPYLHPSLWLWNTANATCLGTELGSAA